ncbi:MAG TPA: hypothetical protein VD962_05735 [Rubricoccaceae bacterium]|nr:hypothetical protein [Rubricoccaceae bacterium]
MTTPEEATRKRTKAILLVLAGLFLLLVLGNVLGWWTSGTSVVGPQGYVPISHGNHVHYVPNGWSGEPPIGQFPQTPPPPGQTIGPNGEFIPLQ